MLFDTLSFVLGLSFPERNSRRVFPLSSMFVLILLYLMIQFTKKCAYGNEGIIFFSVGSLNLFYCLQNLCTRKYALFLQRLTTLLVDVNYGCLMESSQRIIYEYVAFVVGVSC